MAKCVQCFKTKKIYAHGLCSTCYENRQVREQLLVLEECFSREKNVSDYNKSLFALYLTYIRRYHLHYFHLKQTQSLIGVLKKVSFTPITSWMQIYEHELAHPTFYRADKTFKGKTFHKIGCMLQELDILPLRTEEYEPQIKTLLESFDGQTARHLLSFSQYLKKSRRSSSSQISYLTELRDFERWLNQFAPGCSLLTMNSPILIQYLDDLINIKPQGVRITRHLFNHFYRWCLSERLILVHPALDMSIPKPAAKLCVASEWDFEKLHRFVSSAHSHPESAMLIVLVLFFGLTTSDLATAQIGCSNQDAQIEIIFRRKSRTRGRRSFHREQVLKFPIKPAWLLELQKRFYRHWQSRRQAVKSSFPGDPLFFPESNVSNRPLSTDIVLERIKRATREATGHAIPARILRQTCGHLHSMKQDASALSRLGWSPQFAFHYTWLPRVYFNPKNSTPT
jgi:site-specific recombinase XerD